MKSSKYGIDCLLCATNMHLPFSDSIWRTEKYDNMQSVVWFFFLSLLFSYARRTSHVAYNRNIAYTTLHFLFYLSHSLWRIWTKKKEKKKKEKTWKSNKILRNTIKQIRHTHTYTATQRYSDTTNKIPNE